MIQNTCKGSLIMLALLILLQLPLIEVGNAMRAYCYSTAFLSLDILVAFSILRFGTSAKRVSWVGLTQFNRCLPPVYCELEICIGNGFRRLYTRDKHANVIEMMPILLCQDRRKIPESPNYRSFYKNSHRQKRAMEEAVKIAEQTRQNIICSTISLKEEVAILLCI